MPTLTEKQNVIIPNAADIKEYSGPFQVVDESIRADVDAIPTNWVHVINRFGEAAFDRLGFEGRGIAFQFPEPYCQPGRLCEECQDEHVKQGCGVKLRLIPYFKDTNNPNFLYMYTIHSEALDTKDIDRFPIQRWAFQVHVKMPLPNKSKLRTRESHHKLIAMTEDGQQSSREIKSTRVIVMPTITDAYLQELVRRSANNFVQVQCPRMCSLIRPPVSFPLRQLSRPLPKGQSELLGHGHEMFVAVMG